MWGRKHVDDHMKTGRDWSYAAFKEYVGPPEAGRVKEAWKDSSLESAEDTWPC